MQLWSTFNLLTQLSDKDISKSIAYVTRRGTKLELTSPFLQLYPRGAEHNIACRRDTCLEFAHAVCFSAATVILLNLQTLRSSFLQSVVSSHKVFIDIQFNFTRAIFTHITGRAQTRVPQSPHYTFQTKLMS